MKKVCNQIADHLAFYLDGELQGEEQELFAAHLESCAECHKLIEGERAFLADLRDATRVEASPDLRTAVVRVLDNTPRMIRAPQGLRRRLRTIFPDSAVANRSRSFKRRALSLGIVALFLTAIGMVYAVSWRRSTTNPQPSELASMAVESHLRRLRGQLPLEINSDSPEEISSWFRDKVSFSLTLPNYQKASGQDQLYSLEGARLVALKNDYAACVAYRMGGRPITLIVTSNAVALPSGGENIVSKGLTFHYDAISGLKVITWADRGLTYALVSDLEERGQQSCVVCHEGTKDRDFLEGFKPATPRI